MENWIEIFKTENKSSNTSIVLYNSCIVKVNDNELHYFHYDKETEIMIVVEGDKMYATLDIYKDNWGELLEDWYHGSQRYVVIRMSKHENFEITVKEIKIDI